MFLGSLITKMNSDLTLLSFEAVYGLYDISFFEVKDENGNILTICTTIPMFLGSLITKMNSDLTLLSFEAVYGLYDIDLWGSKMKMVLF